MMALVVVKFQLRGFDGWDMCPALEVLLLGRVVVRNAVGREWTKTVAEVEEGSSMEIVSLDRQSRGCNYCRYTVQSLAVAVTESVPGQEREMV